MGNVFQNYIGRIVAFVLTPVLLPLATSFAVWAQDFLGVNLSGDQLTAYVVTFVIGLALVIYKWLANRGEWERAIAWIDKIHDSGGEVPVAPVDPALGLPDRT